MSRYCLKLELPSRSKNKQHLTIFRAVFRNNIIGWLGVIWCYKYCFSEPRLRSFKKSRVTKQILGNEYYTMYCRY